jgi:Holliday junction resolvasome RuvABC endonuclease subunit
MKNIVIGIDPSLRGTAISVFKGLEFSSCILIKTKKMSKPKKKEEDTSEKLLERLKCHRQIKMRLDFMLGHFKPKLIAIEGYSFGGKANLTTQAEVVGVIGTSILKYSKEQKNVKIIIIPPTSVKKYVTGTGSGKKNLILKEVFRRWEYDVSDDNMADAYTIAKIASVVQYYLVKRKFPKEVDKNQKETMMKVSTIKNLIKDEIK